MENININLGRDNIKVNDDKLYLFTKRMLDILGSLTGILLLSPIFLIVAICIKIEDPKGKIFFSQVRNGLHGKEFNIYKFRSMVHNAEDLLEQLKSKNEMDGPVFKMKYDPRITKIGRIIRKTSIDELPQLFNILKGDMSLVGPRPIVDREIELFGDKMKIVHSVRPGLTGYWAANGRSDTTYEQRVEMEAYYAENFSLLLDIKIILKTIKSVIKKEGAI